MTLLAAAAAAGVERPSMLSAAQTASKATPITRFGSGIEAVAIEKWGPFRRCWPLLK
jgi:hypothetical protein